MKRPTPISDKLLYLFSNNIDLFVSREDLIEELYGVTPDNTKRYSSYIMRLNKLIQRNRRKHDLVIKCFPEGKRNIFYKASFN